MKATAKVMLPDCPASAEPGPMIDEIKVGTILIRKGTVLPDSFRLESESYSDGWKLTKDLDGYGLDRRTRGMGWPSSREKSLRRAVNRILTDPKLDGFNSLEITQISWG